MKYSKKYPKQDGWRHAKYAGIPCWFHLWDNTLIGKNWFYNLILDWCLYFDINIAQIQIFKIELIEDEED